VIGGVLQIPGVDSGVNRFLAPTFAGSHLVKLDPAAGTEWVGLVIGALIGLVGVGVAYRVYVAQPGTSARLQARFGLVHKFLFNKWYFDELIDVTVVRPAQWLGRFAASVLERGVIATVVTGGTTGLVSACSAAVRRLQTGFLRYYAAAMVIGVFGMALYFLISAS
jgi:NADH-quinone oxidoreductase subunit L